MKVLASTSVVETSWGVTGGGRGDRHGRRRAKGVDEVSSFVPVK